VAFVNAPPCALFLDGHPQFDVQCVKVAVDRLYVDAESSGEVFGGEAEGVTEQKEPDLYQPLCLP